jgi:3-oxoacyl-(acyl-carrier-protein) synthase
VKAYLGHSLGPASGDQLMASLGSFAHGIVPGIKTIEGVADDVYAKRLHISNVDNNRGAAGCEIAFLNSKGFGGNNATATVLSPSVVHTYLEKHYGKKQMAVFQQSQSVAVEKASSYLQSADKGELNPIYEFGTDLIDESQITITPDAISLPGYAQPITLGDDEGYSF